MKPTCAPLAQSRIAPQIAPDCEMRASRPGRGSAVSGLYQRLLHKFILAKIVWTCYNTAMSALQVSEQQDLDHAPRDDPPLEDTEPPRLRDGMKAALPQWRTLMAGCRTGWV